MSQLSILRILPLLVFAIAPTALARRASPVLPMTLGQTYRGSLTPSPSNPEGEVCYGLSVEPNTRITLKVKTTGVGILKFALYDKAQALRFFHNDVSNSDALNQKLHQRADERDGADSRFSFPVVSEVSQLCLTTTSRDRGQQYDFTATGRSSRKSKSRIALRLVDRANPTPTPPRRWASPIVQTAPKVEIPPPPLGEPYCYVGTWQIADLAAYWLPSVQTFTQAKVTEPLLLGYAKVTINRDGNAVFDALDVEQKFTLKTAETGAKIEKIGLAIAGNANARFQVNADSTLTFSSQNYQRLTTKVNLGTNIKLTGDRLFMLFGNRDLPPVKLPYKCLDRDNLTLKIPLATGQKLIPISLKRIN
ncbi:hypothetical protein [Chamaesiphon sp.]|uniref:hypothetical protein n=1 Tax=Chamaesiphon sp. TaxID=2814140 RepID=UPI0035930721